MFWIFSLIFFSLTNINVSANEVLGCGGYIKSEVDINYSQVSLKLLTSHRSKKYETECAPNNGYYFIPLYDKGDYILKVDPPAGWTFEPEEVNLRIDGETDPCSRNEDINFNFKGFAVIGKVISIGSSSGPAGVTVSLKQGSKMVMSTLTNEEGNFVFTPLASGKYVVVASHPTWKLINDEVVVSVKDQNGNAGNSLVIGGYTLQGRCDTEGRIAEQLYFILHTKVKIAHTLGCIIGKPPGYVAKAEEPAVCYVAADSKGQYKFTGISLGSYKVIPYASSELNYEIVPQSVKVEMTHADHTIDDLFKISGCRMRGNIYLNKQRSPIKGATVTLKEDLKTVTDKNGHFVFESIKFGNHRIQVLSDGVKFKTYEAKLVLYNSQKIEIFPSKYETCFQVSIDSTINRIQSRTISIIGSNSKHQTEIDADGKGCLFLEPGKYSAHVLISTEDEEAGVRFGPEQHTFEVGKGNLDAMIFSQFLGEIHGSIDCLESCKVLTVSLRSSKSHNTVTPRTITSSQGKFSFKDVVPGEYLLTVDKEEWCWKDRTVTVVVNAKIVSAKFQQVGYRLTIDASHQTTISFTTNTGKSGSLDVVQGTSRDCVSSPGKYSFTASGCHRFQSPLLTWDTSAPQLLTLVATHHMVTGSLVSSEPGPFHIRIKSPSGQENSIGPLAMSSKNVYAFEYWLSNGDVVTFTPSSPSNLFQYSPVNFKLEMGSECLSSFVQFDVERALFLKGIVKPAIKGISIKIEGAEEPLSYTTNAEGKFLAGPLDKTRDYVVNAEKLGYTISPSSHLVKKSGSSDVVKISFDAYKLAEINVKIIDAETKSPLAGVLVSTSGGKDYRQNSLTEREGTFAFLALMPAEYFIRPMMKEYKFEPSSKMVQVEGGATVSVEISGTRVAYSIFGKTISLNDEPEVDVTLEAFGTIPPCLEVQEEALADSKGNFRFRGLMPNCNYTIRLKKSAGVNQHVELTLPKEIPVQMSSSDYKGLEILVMRPFLQLDVSFIIHTEPQFLASLTAEVYRDDIPDSPMQVLTVGNHPFFMLPPMMQDDHEYVVQLKSSLPTSQYSFNSPSVSFKADCSFVHLKMKFEPKLKVVEAEISSGTVLGFVIFILGVIIIFNYNTLEPFFASAMAAYSSKKKPSSRSNSLEFNDNTARKRVKLRKI